MFLTFLPESCALILLQQIRIFVVPASAFTYRLTARVFETLDFDKRGDWHDHAWRGGLFAKKG